MQIIKKAVEIGNGAAVYVPREYANREVVITLPEGIEEIKKRILEKVFAFMPDILGIYLVGSYARGEETRESDVDVLVITRGINKRIKEEEYDILFISLEVIKKQLKENALPLLPMLKEAKVIINPELTEKLKEAKLNYHNLRYHIETTKTAMNVVKADIELERELQEKNMSDNLVYSLILRLRTLYIIDCIRRNKMWSKKGLLMLIKSVSGSTKAYEGYLRSKKDINRAREEIPIEEAGKLMNYINKEIREVEKWAGKRK